MYADSAGSRVWEDDEMTLWGDHDVGAIPESIPGRSAFRKWGGLFRKTGDLDDDHDDENDMLECQRWRFLEKNELEKETWRIQNVSAGRSRSHPLGSAAMTCGANHAPHLSYSDGRVHYKDTTLAP